MVKRRPTTKKSATARAAATKTATPPEHRVHFGAHLKVFITAAGLSVPEFARMVGVDQSMVRHVISGNACIPISALTEGERNQMPMRRGKRSNAQPGKMASWSRVLGIKGKQLEWFELNAWLCHGPVELSKIVDRMWKRLSPGNVWKP